ncbi:uncharacterized protein [Physcomitrium patens]|uniref:HTH OST-type domain-containing protein n=1 Tax=Physcomitrium patens TaxID=3218 RepID=A0A2K1L6X1_PHYPA|nr:uncharacterized protein LOC112290592 isoform X1 [Physcomitrium patens]XP_024392797.1 uncharacterized protein LOC112290592 isoform X1 [Physcomitrium patens]PNR61785.1 hypothetical protein PHYPA_000209 [Physcomitrium patens]|eukprot:XP_024392787.1 uncharacterized protein LOC112290592 isoform X1 [Physcomitrella patens]
MALVLFQGRVVPSPTSYASILSYHGHLFNGRPSSSLFDTQLPWNSEHLASNKEKKLPSSRSRLNPCRASTLPQRPFGEHHISRQDRAGTKPDLNSLKQSKNKHVPASSESAPSFPLTRSTSLGQSSVWSNLSPPSHAPPTSFLSPSSDDALSDIDDVEAIRRSSFMVALTLCCALQLLYITDAIRLWVTRLRLRYFDSPFAYGIHPKRSKLSRVGIFWDIENCPIPGGLDARTVVRQMHKIGDSFGTIQCLRAYGKLEYLTRQAPSLLKMGVELCPVPDGKESADKAIIMDALLFGYDHKPCLESDTPPLEVDASTGNGIVLVTGDRGFCALLRELSSRQITTVVIGNGHQKIPPILAQAADFSIQWNEMMEISDSISSSYRHLIRSTEKVSIEEDDSLEFQGWDASSSCNVLLKYESSAEVYAPSSCERSHIVEENQDVETLGFSPDKGIASDLRYREKSKSKNVTCVDTTITEDALSIFGRKSEDDSLPNGRSFCEKCLNLKETCTDIGSNIEIPVSQKVWAPVGGRVRMLRHLRCEVAFVLDKYCKGKPKAAMTFEQFELLYELEMGHPLVSSHYGFATLKSVLQSMPDLVSVRNISSEAADWRVFPYVKRNANDRKLRTNFSRQDLRCILYKILHSYWPHGVPKDQISSEHCKLTGRPLVLVAYEYWKLGDMIQSMGNMMYVDEENKQIYLVDGAPEPRGVHELEENEWN